MHAHSQAPAARPTERLPRVPAATTPARPRRKLAARSQSHTDSPPLETTAEALAAALVRVPRLGGAGLFSFEPDGRVVPLAVSFGSEDRPSAAGAVPSDRAAHLRERAAHGSWIEPWRPRADHPYNHMVLEHGMTELAYAPIRDDDAVVGLVVVGAAAGGGLSEQLPTLDQWAAIAGTLLGPSLRLRSADATRRARIEAIIAEGAFTPVFQPIVELASRAVVGHEALTRFVDGRSPDRVFAEAAESGLALELEAATLGAILEAAGHLRASAWLNLNVSPALLVAVEPLASLLHRWGWQIVLELTEHAQVTDYAAVRSALERLGPTVRLAVDDAGAGFASLRHILELRPDYVKLDRAIVHSVHRDPARRALVAGMVHFASQTGATLVGEGIEREAEAQELARLGVRLGQGYHLGRPAPAGRAVRVAPIVPPTAGPEARRPPATCSPRTEPEDIGRAVNIGETLALALRGVGVASVDELRRIGALVAWERLRQADPRLATGTTLLDIDGAARGVRVTQMAPADRQRLRLLARLGSDSIREA